MTPDELMDVQDIAHYLKRVEAAKADLRHLEAKYELSERGLTIKQRVANLRKKAGV